MMLQRKHHRSATRCRLRRLRRPIRMLSICRLRRMAPICQISHLSMVFHNSPRLFSVSGRKRRQSTMCPSFRRPLCPFPQYRIARFATSRITHQRRTDCSARFCPSAARRRWVLCIAQFADCHIWVGNVVNRSLSRYADLSGISFWRTNSSRQRISAHQPAQIRHAGNHALFCWPTDSLQRPICAVAQAILPPCHLP